MVGAYPVCQSCGSRRVLRDAWAEWNFTAFEWGLSQVFDQCYCEACESDATIDWRLDETFRTKRIRRLNDAMRRGEASYGTVVITKGVQGLGEDALPLITNRTEEFSNFSEENDPHGEHDFGKITYATSDIFWKIDCFDLALKYHSPDAANPDVTHRVLTIMLASEY
ncbi:MAG: DUF3768 domain-containing protein [Pseudomonadota bacterium]